MDDPLYQTLISMYPCGTVVSEEKIAMAAKKAPTHYVGGIEPKHIISDLLEKGMICPAKDDSDREGFKIIDITEKLESDY